MIVGEKRMDAKQILKPYRKTINRLRILFTISIFIIDGMSLIPIMIMPRIIDVYVPQQNLTMILVSLFIFCGIPVLMSLLNTFFEHHIMMMTVQISYKINNACYEKLLYQPLTFFDESYSAELANKCGQEAHDLIAYHVFTIPKLVSNLIMCIAILTLIGLHHWLLAVIQIAYLPFLVIPLEATKKPLKKGFSDIVNNGALLQMEMQQSFHNIKMIKSMRLEKTCLKRAEETENVILKSKKKTVAIDNFVSVWSNTILSWLFQGITFVAAAICFMYGSITIGSLVAVTGYTSRLYSSFFILNRAYMQWGKAEGQTEAIRKFMALSDERDESRCDPWCFDKEIVLDHVSFSYPQADKQIIKDLTLRIPKGQWVGICGPSGVGKTTVFELLSRYYAPEEGHIYVDGKDLQEISIDDVRKNIAYMFQEPYLFSGTIRENIQIGHDTVDQNDLKVALEISGIQESSLEEEVDREAGESGLALSGGEKKRIALSQVILKNAGLLLLDEPMNGLDPASQERICNALKKLQRSRNLTIVSISHQDQFHQFADVKYRLSDGQFQELQ